MRFHLVAATAAAMVVAVLSVGCTTTVSAGASIAPPANCSVDNSLNCKHGSTGFTCIAGANPEDEDSSLSCSIPVADGANDDFCCFTGSFSTTTCTPDDTVSQFCPDPGSFGYVCAVGDDPTSLNSSLICSQPAPDPQFANADDFCCQ
jgi:hypothetical protein